MTRFLLLLVLGSGIFFSCKNEKKGEASIDYTGFVEKMIVLSGLNDSTDQADTLASLMIRVPARLDTFYQWQHYSDCKTCGETKYRLADRRYDQYAENGFFWTVVPDSIYQLNIWHKPYREIPDSISLTQVMEEDSSVYYNRLPDIVSSLADVDFFKREFRKIGDRNYVITGFVANTGYLTQSKTIYFVALTHLRSRPLYFIAECSAKDTAGFINNMYKSLLSIRITEK